MKKVTLLLALSLLLVSCAKEMSREEQLAINNKNISAANKIYSGFSKEDIANAVTKTLELIDPSDSKFTHYENKIIMMRRYFFTLLFNTVIGSDCWVVTFEKLNARMFPYRFQYLLLKQQEWFQLGIQQHRLTQIKHQYLVNVSQDCFSSALTTFLV